MEEKFFNAFNQISQIGPIRFKKLISYFNNLERAWQASSAELEKAGIEKNVVNEIIAKRPLINPDREMEKVDKCGLKILTIKNKNYPALLKEIYNPPAILYYKGTLQGLNDFNLAIVGTRRPSKYGQQVAIQLARQLSEAGFNIISGLAQGIDSYVHQSVVEGGGRTIAVIGSGLDYQSIYPAFNRRLVDKIIDKGVVLTEYPVGTPALSFHFPARNRIISGLSQGVLVIEAGEKSGALITAKYALEQNREVFAVPGSIYNPFSRGSNNLIKLGAKLVNQAQDVLDEFNLNLAIKERNSDDYFPETTEEAILLKLISNEPVHIDKLIQKSNLGTAVVNRTLITMEMKGKIKNLGGNQYVLSH